MQNQVTTTCKNCGYVADLNFCPKCGQRTDVKRFDGKYLLYKVVHSFDLDRGFFYTLLQLMTRPGLAVRGYVDGIRIGFSSPFKVFLIIGAVATLYTVNSGSFQPEGATGSFVEDLENWDGFIINSGKYYSFFQLTGSLVFSLFTWIVFLRSRFNFSEILVLNIYIVAGQLLILILFAPFAYLFDGNLFDTASGLSIAFGIFSYGYHLWSILTFFNAVNFRSISASLLVTALPLPAAVFTNYWIYSIAPESFWQYLGNI